MRKGVGWHRKQSRQLTVEELELLGHMMSGLRYSDIAVLLGCPVRTVRSRAVRIYDKLGAGNRVEAVMFAMDLHELGRTGFYGS